MIAWGAIPRLLCYWRKSLNITTLFVELPRLTASCLPSPDHPNPLMFNPAGNFVIWRGAPPANGCSQMFPAPPRVIAYWIDFPSGEKCTSFTPVGILKEYNRGPPSAPTTPANIVNTPSNSSWYVYRTCRPSGEISASIFDDFTSSLGPPPAASTLYSRPFSSRTTTHLPSGEQAVA